MNLHGIVRGVVGAVNPHIDATVQVSGGYTTNTDGTQVPSYQAPGAITASLTGNTLDVTAVASGYLAADQTLVDASGSLLVGTKIQEQLTGTAGGIGTYLVDRTQTVASESMTTVFNVRAQVQALSFKDLTQIDGLNLNGTKRAIYVNNRLDGIVRPDGKGGDLITIPSGVSKGVWLIAMVLEQWPDWCKVVATLQDGA